jgi:hypothetical protein
MIGGYVIFPAHGPGLLSYLMEMLTHEPLDLHLLARFGCKHDDGYLVAERGWTSDICGVCWGGEGMKEGVMIRRHLSISNIMVLVVLCAMWLYVVVSRGLEETKLPEAFWVSHQKRLFL